MKTLATIVWLGSVLVLGGCGSAAQSINVTTTPVGAQITLIRYGVNHVDGSVPGVAVSGVADTFVDPPLALGTSPVRYEFELEERGRQVAVGAFFVKVTRVFTEGLIRAEMDGRVAERRVRFSGTPVTVDLTLPPR